MGARLGPALAALLVLAAVALPAGAAEYRTIIEGDYPGGLVLSRDASPYLVRGSVGVSGSLVVEPGVEVYFEPGAEIVVYGDARVGGGAEPVVIVALEGGPARLIVSRGEALIGNVEIHGVLTLSAGASRVDAYRVQGALALYRIVDSAVEVRDSVLDALLLLPGYTGEEPRVDPAVEDSTLTLRRVRVGYYVAGGTGGAWSIDVLAGRPFEAPPRPVMALVENSSVLVVDSLLGGGIALSLRDSRLSIDSTVAREVLLGDVIDSNVSITGSVIAYGRGVYVDALRSAFHHSSLSIRGSMVYGHTQVWENGTVTHCPVLVAYQSAASTVEVLDSWLDPPVVKAPGPVEARLLAEPPSGAPEASLVLDPPMPLAGSLYRVIVDSPEPPAVLVVIEEWSLGYMVLVDYDSGSLLVEAPESPNGEVTAARLLVVALYPGGAAGFSKTLILLTNVSASLEPVSPTERILSEARVNFTFTVTAPQEIIPYLRVAVTVDGAVYNASQVSPGVYTLTVELGDGLHEWNATLYYGPDALDAVETRTLLVDTTPPEIRATASGDTVELTVSDEVSGVATVRVLGPAGEALYEKRFDEPRETHKVTLAAIQGPITVIAVDAAGNQAVKTITLAPVATAPATAAPPPQQETTTGGEGYRAKTLPPGGEEEGKLPLAAAAVAAAIIAAAAWRRRRRKHRAPEEYLLEEY